MSAGADDRADEAGRFAAERAGVRGLGPEPVRVLGRLRPRASFGQNVLEHLVKSALTSESETVVNGIAAHHDEVPAETVEAVLVQVADAMSAARPGARREDTDQHVERLEQLEELVAGHAGVRRALAMAAGREMRVQQSLSDRLTV